MSPDEFRRNGHAVVEWIADYLATVQNRPVLPRTVPGEVEQALPSAGPNQHETFEQMFADFQSLIVPNSTQWNHPRFFGYFSISSSAPGILGEMLAASLDINHMVWRSGPAATELEQTTLAWLRDWMGLPQDWFGIIYDTASISTMHALICAREQIAPEAHNTGNPGDLIVYTSEQAHSSVEKGAIAAGFGQNNVRKIPVDNRFQMRAEALREQIGVDLAQNKRPCCIVPTVGTTSTTSIDPVPEIVAIARQCGAWLHVDASYAGPAAVVPEYRDLLRGCDLADSLVVNPHKWLFTPTDISVFYTAKPQILRRAFSLIPEYLRTAEDDRVTNLMDYGVQLGRRFRSLKLWFVMRYFGLEGIQEILRNHIQWAQRLATKIAAHPDFELSAPVPLSLICFRLRGGNERSRALLDAINATGQAFLSHTVLHDQFVLRLAIGNVKTEWSDLELTWQVIQDCAATIA